MFTNILIGCLLIALTCLIHTYATWIIFNIIQKKHKINTRLRRILHVDYVVLIMILASLLEAAIWAKSYLILDAIGHFEEALYFSIVTYTTLGYGDITLSEEFRLLASFEAANGIIIFGWSTAIVMSALQYVYMRNVN